MDKDLSWEEYSDRYYTEIETDVSLQWEKMWRDFKSLNRWAKERIQGMLKEFEEYSTDCTDPDEFISKKLKCEYDELRDEAYDLKERTKDVPVIELILQIREEKEIVDQARIDMEYIERRKSEASIRRIFKKYTERQIDYENRI